MIAETFLHILKNMNVAHTFSYFLKYNDVHDEKGRFATKGGISSSGSEIVNITGFKNIQKRNNHFQKHGKEFPECKTPDDFEKKATELLNSKCNKKIIGYLAKNDKICRFNTSTGVYATGNSKTGSVFTMFKPGFDKRTGINNLQDARKYYDAQMQKEGIKYNE